MTNPNETQQPNAGDSLKEKTVPDTLATKYKTYFHTSEQVSPTQIRCLIEAEPRITFYNKKHKDLQFSSSNIEVIANTSGFSDDGKIRSGSLLVVAKLTIKAGAKLPDIVLRKKYFTYANICDLKYAYTNLNKKILQAYAKKEKVVLRDWETTKTD